ncbi:MAG: hypothetical protein ACFFHV_20270 [Promethearchaeota archaeon]
MGLSFAFAITFTFLTFKSIVAFFSYLTMMFAFMVRGGVLDLWVLTASIIGLCIFYFIEIMNLGGGKG